MANTKISEFSSTPGNNTDIDGINIAEGCAPSGINNAIRELMSQLKDFQAGTAGDSFNGPIGTTTAAAVSATTLTTSSTVTLNGGTANGVPYLNGSKVLTSGSALQFDGSNLGLGVTPSAWQSGVPAFESTLGIYSGRTESNLTSNAYFNSGWKYIATGLATQYQQQSSQHRWFNAASGTAGNAISFTQAMTLDASGNLGIGTSSPAYRLDASAAGTTVSSAFRSDQSEMWMMLKDSGTTLGHVRLGSSSGAMMLYAGNAERARIDSSGNLLLKATSAGTSAVGVFGMGNATAPSSSPAGMGQLYVEGGALKFRGSSGTVTTIAPA